MKRDKDIEDRSGPLFSAHGFHAFCHHYVLRIPKWGNNGGHCSRRNGDDHDDDDAPCVILILRDEEKVMCAKYGIVFV